MTPLQQLTDKIHKLVPETMEVSLGCRGTAGGMVWVASHKGGFWVSEESPFTMWESIEPIEIIGHPITLEHVLQAITVISERMGEDSNLTKSIVEINMVLYRMWRLGKPLSEQEEDTIIWLNGVITSY